MDAQLPVFYSRPGLQVDVYDAECRSSWSAKHDDASFYLEEARRAGGPVLELACGTGRITFSLLSAGVDVHGLDNSEPMLRLAKEKLAQLPPDKAGRLHLHLADMTDFDLGQKFSLIIIAYRSFQCLLTPEAQRRCLQKAREHLVPGGKLIVDIFDPLLKYIAPGQQTGIFQSRTMAHPSGNQVVAECLKRENNVMPQIFKEHWRYVEKSAQGNVLRQVDQVLEMRWTFRHEFRYLAELCGFHPEAEYSDFHRNPPAYGKEQIWILRANGAPAGAAVPPPLPPA
ncbi:MAG: methyltransferase domain-containing protein [Verrucomicrobium sp.]|nr:methyltransferase domain-containing protein [Verrucomicrobium sp.]